jgi:hypothetical protein
MLRLSSDPDLPHETDLIGEQLPPNDLPVAPGYGAKLQLKGLVRRLVSPNADDCPAGLSLDGV